ncbi:MAG: hypothetical protein AAF840_07755, partial [Bacteroidota bacterium]
MDASQKVPERITNQIRADLRRLDDRNVSVYCFVGSETVPFKECTKLMENKAKEYDLVLAIIWNQRLG